MPNPGIDAILEQAAAMTVSMREMAKQLSNGIVT
jgi:hypothetical protein